MNMFEKQADELNEAWREVAVFFQENFAVDHAIAIVSVNDPSRSVEFRFAKRTPAFFYDGQEVTTLSTRYRVALVKSKVLETLWDASVEAERHALNEMDEAVDQLVAFIRDRRKRNDDG